tara:strand:- start:539 stop:1312 length:774 start_codon:yes stop_codon:yes gene_type:complete
MATMDELRQQDYAKYIMPGYREMIDPKNVPTGQQLAPGLTQMQQDATALAKAGIGSYQPFLTAGAQSLQAGQAALGPGGAQAYMNPFISQVRDTTMTDLNKMFGQQTAQQQQRAIQSGSFAGSGTRDAIMSAELARGQADTAAKTLSNLNMGGYQAAQKAALQGGLGQLQAGKMYQGLGAAAQSGLSGDISQLYGLGENQRQITGAQNLATYQTPFYGLSQYASALQGAPTSAQQFQSPNPILSGLQAGLGAYSMLR